MVRHRLPLPVAWAAACKLALLLALLWQATGSSAMALMGCCLAPQPSCVVMFAASHCVVCAPAAVLETAADPPAAIVAIAVVAIDLQARRWVDPVDDIWRPPTAEHRSHRFNVSIQSMRFT